MKNVSDCVERENAPKRQSSVALVLLLIVSLVALYGVQGNTQEVHQHGRSAIGWMVKRWSGSGGDLSHGWIIPLVSLYVIWRRRSALAAAPKAGLRSGYAVVALALLLHWIGVRAQLTRLSLFSMIVLLWGMPLAVYGWGAARQLVFPCAYLLFCIPFSFLNSMTVPLRLLASSVSAHLLNGLGIAATRAGTAIYSAAGGGFNFDVADACSGLRSLIALSALTAAYANLTQKGLVRQWILFLAAAPLAIVGNITRIVTVALVAQSFGLDWAMRVYHDLSGFIVFAVAILLMMALGRVLDYDASEWRQRWRVEPRT